MPLIQTLSLRAFASAVMLMAPLAGEGRAAPLGVVTTIKDWAVVCDNLRNCEADGFAADDVDKPAILILTRGGAPGEPAAIEIRLLDDTSATRRGAALTLAVDDHPVLTVQADPAGVVRLAPAQVGPLLGAARNGTLLSIRAGDQALGLVSLAGMVAALRLVDDQQRRVDTVTAMIAKGPKPLSAVPSQPPLPVVRRAPAVAQTGLARVPPASERALSEKADCAAAQGGLAGAMMAYRLSADQVLWKIPCGAGAYNDSSLLFIVGKGGAARLAPLEGVADGLAVNVDYDPQTRILGGYDKGRGIGDCGEAREWAWTGQAFVLTRATSMPVCHGQADWPTSFQARVK